jgi:hypothetical protein
MYASRAAQQNGDGFGLYAPAVSGEGGDEHPCGGSPAGHRSVFQFLTLRWVVLEVEIMLSAGLVVVSVRSRQ